MSYLWIRFTSATRRLLEALGTVEITGARLYDWAKDEARYQ